MHNIRINQVYPTALRSNASLVLLPVLGVMITTTSASAQVLPSNNSATVVTITGDRTHTDTPVQLDITGGQLSNDEANLFHGFEQFDITAEQTANFVTKPEVQNVVGRVNSDRASTINGMLQVSGSDANLYLMNPAGILTGPDAQLNLSGGFTATTATGIEFENGQFAATENVNDLTGAPTGFRFDVQQVGAVVNLGDLSVEDGESLTLVGGTVVNTGSLSAPSGTVTMAAVEGESTVRISQGDQLLSLEIEANQQETSAYSTIAPSSIAEMLTGGDFSDATALVSNADGTVNLSGSHTASSEAGARAISESGGVAIASGAISTSGETGGNINVLGNQVTIQEAVLNASGDHSGGFIRVGGDYKGQGPVVNASHTLIHESSSLQADAIQHGNGGRIIVWADDATHYSGQISAQGGFSNGNGGFAEVSGKTNLSFDGSVNLSAPQGEFGTLLIDPENIEITDGTQSGTANTTYFTSAMVEDLFNMNVVLEATNNISIHDISDNDLSVNTDQSITFTADSDNVADGAFQMGLGDTIRAKQGNVTITGAGITVGTIDTSTDEHNSGGASGIAGGDVTLNSSQGVIASEILTYGFLTSTPHHAPDGGNVSISALNGDIEIEKSIQTFSAVDGEEAATAGNITLFAQGNISVSTANPTTNSVLLASSQAQTHESGNGGAISLTAITGNIDIAGYIASESRAEGNDDGDSNAGNGGNIFLTAEGDILTRAILNSSTANGDRAGNGGDINISSTSGLANIGDIQNFSTAIGSDSGNAGNLNITANNITTGSIDTSSNAANNAGNAGGVILTSSDTLLANGINATSNGGGNNADITLTGDRTDVTNDGIASISGENVRFQTATNSKNIILGGNARSLTDITLLESDLAALNNISLLTIGQADSNNTITLKESLNGSVGSRPRISIIGGESIIGPDNTDNIFQITDVGSGSLLNTDVAFSNIENLVGGNQNDSFEFIGNGRLLGSIDGRDGIDSLDYSSTATTPIQIDLDNMSTTGVSAFTNIENIIGSSANRDRIIGTVENDTFVITESGSGKVNDALTFSSIEELSGNTGTDTLSYEDYVDAIIVDIENMSATDVSRFSNIETIIGSRASNDQIHGSRGDDSFSITAENTGTVNGILSFSDIETLDALAGNDTLDYSGFNTEIEVNLANSNATGITAFNGIDNIVGSSSNNDRLIGLIDNDTFELTSQSAGTVNGGLSFSAVERIDGNLGEDILDYSNYGSSITVDLENRNTTSLSEFANIETIIGSNNDGDQIIGTDANDTFSLISENAGTVNTNLAFAKIERLEGGPGTDTLSYTDYASAIAVDLENNRATGISEFGTIEKIIGSTANNDIITGSIEDDSFEITASNTGIANSNLLFSEIETIEGNAGNDTIIGSTGNDHFQITEVGVGNVNNNLAFLEIESIEGQQGNDTLDYSGYSSQIEIDFGSNTATGLDTFNSIETAVGSGANNDKIIGPTNDNVFVLTNNNAGTINGSIEFSQIESIEGNIGNDILDYRLRTTSIEVDIGTNSATDIGAFSNIENVIGSSANNDKIIGSTGNDNFEITDNATGNINNSLAFSAIEVIEGSSGIDTINYSNYDSEIEVDLSLNRSTGIAQFNGIEEVVGSRANTDTIRGSGSNDTFSITGVDSGIINHSLSFSSIEDFEGGGGANTLSLNDIPTGGDRTWRLDGVNRGTVNGLAFNNFSMLVGSTEKDTFTLTDGSLITGAIDGNAGADTLDYSSYEEEFEVDVGRKTGTGIAAFSSIEEIIGNQFTESVIEGSSNDDTFVITSDGSGRLNDMIAFSNISSINGQGGNNTLIVASPAMGNRNDWIIKGNNSGSINDLPFQGIQNLTGGDSNDSFQFVGSGKIEGTVTGGGGIDSLDYSQYLSPISVDLSTRSTTSESILLSTFSGIESIEGTNVDTDQIIGTNANDIFDITDQDHGRVNNDIAFSDIEILNGGKGSDSFRLNNFMPDENIIIIGGNDVNNGLPNNRLISNGNNTTWRIDGNNQGLLRQAGNTIAAFSEIQRLENSSPTGGETEVFFENAMAQITGSINSGSSNLTLRGDDINIGQATANGDMRNATIAGNGTLTIRPNSEAISIELGGVDNQDDISLAITEGELAAIQRGFNRILIGGDTHTGGISLEANASFQDSVVLRSQASIDTRNGEVSTTNGSITLQTDASIVGNRFSAQEDAVTLMAQQDIVIDSLVARGGEGITIKSNRGSVTVNNTLDTEGEVLGNNVNILAENSVDLGSINTTGGRQSGDISIESQNGGITTSGITTTNGISTDAPGTRRPGNVTLNSPQNIQVDFIDARGNGQNTESSRINIDTQDNFRAVGAIANSARGSLSEGVSISTRGAQDGNVRIQYGNSRRIAKAFHIGDISDNGLAASLEVPTTTILEGDFFRDYQQDNIELVNRGILPANFSENRVILALEVGAVQFVETAETDSEAIFEQIEARNAQAFSNYLGLPEDSQIYEQITLQDVQQALGEIELSTEITPGLVYVYFVPDAAAESSVGRGQKETISPDDQLEVMLITQEGSPIRRRQWGITRAQVDEANRTLRQQATSQFSTARQYLPPAQQLYNWIVKPVTDALQQQSINSLGFVMDTGMRTMPIGVLHDGEQYLVENYSLGMLPSFSFSKISDTGADNSRINLEETRVLAMGASQFENKADLPAVDAEITLISEQLWEGDAFLNEEFVLKNLQRQLQKEDYDIIHLATHAVFDSGNLADSYIQLWDEKLSLNELNKLQLSDEDIKLIILSACNTALGDPSAEYGFAGLAINSGARSALASLWPVNDEGTFAFMSQFYTQLRESSVTAEALQQAQIQLINGEITINDGVVYDKNNEEIATLPALKESGRWDFSHPFYWSPFTMIGNPW